MYYYRAWNSHWESREGGFEYHVNRPENIFLVTWGLETSGIEQGCKPISTRFELSLEIGNAWFRIKIRPL